MSVALPGCTSVSNMFTPTPAATDASAAAPAAPAALTANDFECPGVDIRPGASTLSVNGKGDEPGALALRYQGSIVRTARECIVSNGQLTIRVGVEGRVVLGPAGGPGQLDVPVRFAAVLEGVEPKTLASKLQRTTVAIAGDATRVDFALVAEDLTLPMPKASDIDRLVVYVGFDTQPEPKAKPAPRKRRSS